MKLLQISKYYYPYIGGTEQVARDISNSLLDCESLEQEVICFNDSREDKIEYLDNYKVIRCGCFKKIASQPISLSYYSLLKKELSEFNPDIIIFHYPNPLVSSFLLKIINEKTRLILYWHLDITKQKLLGKFFYKQNINLLERANNVVATSPNYIEGSKFLTKYKSKCIVIPNCVSIDFNNIKQETIEKGNEIRNKYNNKFICFTVGRHIPYKGFEYLIESSKYLNTDYKILIGGKGPLTSKLTELSKNNNIVELVGFISDEDLIAYYLACDVITFSSITKNEAFGISLAEGMSFGKPAITFNIPGSGVNYVNLNGVTGIECKNKDTLDYANAIIKLSNNKDIRTKYGEAAKERVEKNFTFDKFKHCINDLIQNDML